MTKFLIICALIVTGSVTVDADNIRLASGKYLSGHVTSFTNAAFQVELENHSTTNLPAQTIQTIDFENELVESAIELTVQSGTKGKVSLYNKGALSVENEDGQVNRIPLALLSKITFGNPIPEPAKKDDPKAPAKPDSVAKIEEVTGSNLPKYVVRGKVTIVDFYADWCGPCRRIGPYLEELTKKNDSVILRRVNIDNNKELAAKFDVSAIPNIIVYDKAGRNIGTVRGANQDGVDQLIAKANVGN